MAKETKQKDIIIIGAGMAGLTAALYAGRMNLSVLVLENALIGGQIANATGIENYPGHKVIAGGNLIATVQQQAESFGAEVDEFDPIERVDLTKSPKITEDCGNGRVHLRSGCCYHRFRYESPQAPSGRRGKICRTGCALLRTLRRAYVSG